MATGVGVHRGSVTGNVLLADFEYQTEKRDAYGTDGTRAAAASGTDVRRARSGRARLEGAAKSVVGTRRGRARTDYLAQTRMRGCSPDSYPPCGRSSRHGSRLNARDLNRALPRS